MSSLASSAASKAAPHYFVPAPSAYPILASTGLFFVILGGSQWINGADWGAISLAAGMAMWLATLFFWFSESIRESESGLYGYKIDLSYRWAMSWFIFSEVMFFGAFFTALWWTRAVAKLPAALQVLLAGSYSSALLRVLPVL